jgi:hypothetical protein
MRTENPENITQISVGCNKKIHTTREYLNVFFRVDQLQYI